ncbi:hypothetical protein K1T71_010493 [Dendrolimus kikuchii]|uniref:Uncharacterized protein n=1 Tax=Dendrolimus kikuchii TaxID=765133 RepID=A0ACC1CRW6_9NEOP|nr:hypothetical protein K1T71_010493 [Dendrolimus kikuchii]
MVLLNKAIYIVGAKRTPFCKYGGPLRELPSSQAFAVAARDAILSANLEPEVIDQTVVGNVNYLSQCDGGKTPRYCGLFSGVPIDRPALGVNKACGTGIQAIITAVVDIVFGTSKLCLSGGTEIMSSLPLLVRNVRFGTSLGVPYKLEDHIQKQLFDTSSGCSALTKTAEDLATKYGMKREDIDTFARESYLRWKKAQESNIFRDEITSLTVTLKKKEIVVDKDITSQMDNLVEAPTLLEEGKLITAGNSSAPADGAAALLLSNEESLKTHNLKPLARISGWACVGVDPVESGLGGMEAIKNVLEQNKLGTDDVDLYEINDTYVSEVLITAKELKVNMERINVNGGTCVLGHPVAATGARMATHLVYELRRRNLKRGIAASSCGGGQGVAIMVERI